MTDDRLQRLTDGQKACLQLVSRGLSSKEIAIETGLSPQTVDQYLSRAASALGATNRREAARAWDSIKNNEFNKSEFKPQPVAALENPANLELSTDDGKQRRPRNLLTLLFPPIGGERHELKTSQTIVSILRVAVVSTSALGLLIATFYWLNALLL